MLVKRTPFGTIYTQPHADTLYIRCRGRRVATHLPNTPECVKIAVERLRMLYLDVTGNKPTMQSRKRLDELWGEFVADHGADKAERTVGLYREVLRGMGDYYVTEGELKAEVLRIKARKDLRPATKEIRVRVICTFANWCVRNGYIAKNPITKDFKPKSIRKPVRVFTLEEAVAIRAELTGALALYWWWLWCTGFRPHEALNMRWDDITKDRIYMMSKDKREEVYFPRNEITDELLKHLEPYNTNGKVFPWKLSSTSRLHRTLIEAMKRAGVKPQGRSFYALRKSYATRLASEGVNAQKMSVLMRHDIQTSMKYYVKFPIEELRKSSVV